MDDGYSLKKSEFIQRNTLKSHGTTSNLFSPKETLITKKESLKQYLQQLNLSKKILQNGMDNNSNIDMSSTKFDSSRKDNFNSGFENFSNSFMMKSGFIGSPMKIDEKNSAVKSLDANSFF